MKKYEITTTSMRKIIIDAETEESAIKTARTQFDDGEDVMMISSITTI